jgi:hypothetical protein
MSTLRLVVLEQDGTLIAQGLEYDIAVQAPDIETLHRRFIDALTLEAMEGLGRIAAAPEEIQILWTGGA